MTFSSTNVTTAHIHAGPRCSNDSSSSTSPGSRLRRCRPYELIPSKWGTLPRWHVNAQLTGEMRSYERVRNDAIEAEAKLADVEAREKAMLAEHLALQTERAAFDVEKRAFADQAAALAGRLSVEWGRIEKLRADHA